MPRTVIELDSIAAADFEASSLADRRALGLSIAGVWTSADELMRRVDESLGKVHEELVYRSLFRK